VDDNNGNSGTIKITGSINADKGTIDIAAVVLSDKQGTVDYVSATLEIGVIFLEDPKGVVRIKPDISTKFSFRIDVNDQFMIDTDIFQINEYKDLLNLDYLANVLTAIKQQLILNKESEISEELQAAESVALQRGQYKQIDFDNPPINIQAATVFDYFTLVVPKIIGLARKIEKVSKVSPQYIIAAPETAAFLELLRSVATQFTKGNGATPSQGVLGPAVASSLAYSQFQILVSHAIPEGKFYLLYKSNNPQYMTLVDFIYKPLLITQWDKKFKQRKYLTTFDKILLLRPEYTGYIEFVGTKWQSLI